MVGENHQLIFLYLPKIATQMAMDDNLPLGGFFIDHLLLSFAPFLLAKMPSGFT